MNERARVCLRERDKLQDRVNIREDECIDECVRWRENANRANESDSVKGKERKAERKGERCVEREWDVNVCEIGE